jgi:hypothetical protein
MDPLDGKDEFYVEIAWSVDGEFPWRSMGKTEIDRESGRGRLARQWQKFGADPHWDLAPEKTAAMDAHIDALAKGRELEYPSDLPVEQLLPRVDPLVRDAIAKLEEYGMPLFRRVAEARGLRWPST